VLIKNLQTKRGQGPIRSVRVVPTNRIKGVTRSLVVIRPEGINH